MPLLEADAAEPEDVTLFRNFTKKPCRMKKEVPLKSKNVRTATEHIVIHWKYNRAVFSWATYWLKSKLLIWPVTKTQLVQKTNNITRSKYVLLTQREGNRVRAGHDRFTFFFWMVKKVARVFFFSNQSLNLEKPNQTHWDTYLKTALKLRRSLMIIKVVWKNGGQLSFFFARLNRMKQNKQASEVCKFYRLFLFLLMIWK